MIDIFCEIKFWRPFADNVKDGWEAMDQEITVYVRSNEASEAIKIIRETGCKLITNQDVVVANLSAVRHIASAPYEGGVAKKID